jgi:molybdopterin converting factor small subunit
VVPHPASVHAVSLACSRPSAVSGESALPCQRCTAFHSLCPWRRIKIDTSEGIPIESTGNGTLGRVALIRLFAAAREAAGTGRDELPGGTVGEVLGEARRRYGDGFDAVLGTCKIWVNGEPAAPSDPIGSADELAVLPPVSGGATEGGMR